MVNPRKSQEWNQDQETKLNDLKEKWLSKAEPSAEVLLNPYKGEVNDMLGDLQKRYPKFSDHVFDDYTLFYRKPEKFWNEVGLLVPMGIDKSAPVKVHVFFMGGGFVSITVCSLSKIVQN